MDGNKTNYSRTEWGSLSIQDRMRAMKDSMQDQEQEADHADSLAQPTKPFLSPTHQKKDSMTSVETADLSEMSDVPPRRSSVVDMWRKREGSTTQGSGTPQGRKPRTVGSVVSPLGDSQRQVVIGTSDLEEKQPRYNFEEKKEPTFEDDPAWNASQSPSAIFKPATPSPAHREEHETSQKEAQPSLPRSQQELGAPKSQEEEMSSRSRRPGMVDAWKKRSSGTTSASEMAQEESLRRSKNLPPLPIPSPARSSTNNFCFDPQVSENKVADTSNANSEQGIANNELSQESPASHNSRSKIRNMWMHRESSLRLKGIEKGTDELEGEQPNMAGSASFGSDFSVDPTNADSNAGSHAGSMQSKGIVLDRWSKPGQDNPASPIPSVFADLNGQRQSPVAHNEKDAAKKNERLENVDTKMSNESPSVQTDGSPAFSDARAKWAKFGNEKEHAREGLRRGSQQKINSPRVWTPKNKDPQDFSNDGQDVRPDGIGQDFSPQAGLTKQSSFANRRATRDGASEGESGHMASKSPVNGTSKQSPGLRRESMLRRNRLSGMEQNKTLESENFDNIAGMETEPSESAMNSSVPPGTPRAPTIKQRQASIDSPAAGSVEGNDTPTGSRKNNHLVKLGQMHASRPKSLHEIVAQPDLSTMAQQQAKGGISLEKRQSGKEEYSEPSRMFSDNPNRGRNGLRVRTTSLDGTQSALPRQSSPANVQDEPGLIVTKAMSPESTRPTKKFDKKALLAHRRRSSKSNDVNDDQSFASDALSDVFSDTIPDDQRRKLSAQLTSVKSSTPRSKVSMMQTLMTCGVNEDQVFGDPVYAGKPQFSPARQSEYSSLCVSDSTSFLIPEAGRSNNVLQSTNELSSFHDDALSDAGLSEALSNDGSIYSGISLTAASPRSATASSLASRAGRRLREKRLRKPVSTSDDLPVSAGGRPSTMVDSRTLRNRANPVTPASNNLENEDLLAAKTAREIVDPTLTATTHATSPVAQNPDELDYSNVRTQATATAELTSRRTPSFSSDTTATNSQMISTVNSTIASEEASSRGDKMPGSRTPRDRGLEKASKKMVTDKFVSESKSNVEAFKSTFRSLSLEQMAKDLKDEVALNVQGLDFKKFATDLNDGMTAASESLNKFVGTDVFSKGTRRVPAKREPSPVEEVAIEVEYIEASDEEESVNS